MKVGWRLALASTIALCLGQLAVAGGAQGEPAPVRDTRIGNNTEALTSITSGPHAGQVAVLDGYDVLAVPAHGAPQLLFSTKGTWAEYPSGFAWVPGEDDFVFSDQGDLDSLVVIDGAGHRLPSRPIHYLPGSPAVAGAEGIAYLGPSSPWPDSIARAVWDGEESYLEVLGRDGTVRRDIAVTLPPDASPYVSGLAWDDATGRFLVSTGDQDIWVVDPAGSVVRGPVELPEAADVEGIARAGDGRFYAADYTAGRLFAFDPSLARVASSDRSIATGPGISRSYDATWDPTGGGYAVLGLDRNHLQTVVGVLSPDLTTVDRLFHLDGARFGLTVLPDGSFATCGRPGPVLEIRGRTGGLLSVIPLPARCETLTYLPLAGEFVVVLATQPGLARVIGRDGTVGPTFPIDGSATLATDGRHVLTESYGGVETTYDATGHVLSSRQLAHGGMVLPFATAIGRGGSYALVNPYDSELAVYGPPGKPANTTCTNQQLTGTYANVKVARGAWCDLVDASVLGNLDAKDAAGLAVVATSVTGNVSAGNLTGTADPSSPHADLICASTVAGNVTVTDARPGAPWDVGGCGVNTIRGNLDCHGNQEISGGDNAVGGNRSGQCASFGHKLPRP